MCVQLYLGHDSIQSLGLKRQIGHVERWPQEVFSTCDMLCHTPAIPRIIPFDFSEQRAYRVSRTNDDDALGAIA